MSKKNDDGRLVIPEEFLAEAPAFNEKDNHFFFLMNAEGEVGISCNYLLGSPYLPRGGKFIGNCDYDINTHSFPIPENVEIALGEEGTEYLFATAYTSIPATSIYLFKRKSSEDELNKMKMKSAEDWKKLFASYNSCVPATKKKVKAND